MKQKNIYIITLSLFLLLTTLNLVSSEQEIKNKDISLEIIDNNITFYRDRVFGAGLEPVMNPEGYLFEGEKIKFKVKVYSYKGIEEIKDVYVTANKEIEVNCPKEEIIDNFNQIWSCTLTAETSESMYGVYDINVVAESISGEKVSKYIGTFFFNPYVHLDLDKYQINFPKVHSGDKIYSNFIKIKNNVDDDSNVSLKVLITASRVNLENKCIGDTLPLSSIYYYAENGKYSTKDDPRADKEGFVKITEMSDNYDKILKSYLILNHSLINEKEDMNIRFRINVPKDCNGNYKGQIYFWGNSRGPSIGNVMDINLNITKDSTPPEAKIRFNSNIFEVNGFDDENNVTTTKKITCLKKNGEVCSKELRRFVIKDEAGNDLSLNVIYEKVGGQTKTTISSLDYNGGKLKDYNEEGKIESNWFWFYTFPNFQEKVIQNLKIGNEYVTTYYNPTTNKTRIEIKNKTGSKSYTEEGYNYVELKTDKGKLKYEMKRGVLPVISEDIYEILKNSEKVRVLIFVKEEFNPDFDMVKNQIISDFSLNEFEYKGEDKEENIISGYINYGGLEKLRYNQNIYKIQKEIIVSI